MTVTNVYDSQGKLASSVLTGGGVGFPSTVAFASGTHPYTRIGMFLVGQLLTPRSSRPPRIEHAFPTTTQRVLGPLSSLETHSPQSSRLVGCPLWPSNVNEL